MNGDTIAEFIARQRRERIAAGLPATIVDADTLRLIAALVANTTVGAAYYSAMEFESRAVNDAA